MKTSIFLAFIAFLAGTSIFGIYKSLELARNNADLKNSTDRMKIALATSEISLREAKGSLAESYSKNQELEKAVGGLRMELVQSEKKAQEFLENISILTKNLKEVAQANTSLSETNNELRDRAMRTEFENAEMKKKLSSVKELKIAIRELKTRNRGIGRQRAVPAKPQKAEDAEKRKEVSLAAQGNQGFIVKDGRPTFQDLVNIQVKPAEL